MYRKGEISASMMCSHLADLKKTIDIFEKQKIEYLHIDVMDGEFVPNFGLGADYIKGLRSLTNISLDLHLMIKDPEYKLQWIGIYPDDIVSIHYESTYHIQRALDWLRGYGCKCFLAINPATPVYALEEIIDYVDGINLLMVNPGFAGQSIVPSTLKKAKKLQKFLQDNGKDDIIIEVDGNITNKHAAELKKTSASLFVAGTSSIFHGSIDELNVNIEALRKAIQ